MLFRSLQVATVDVATGQLHDSALADRFSARVQASSGNQTAALLMHVNTAAGLKPGTYDVLLQLLLPATDAAGKPEIQQLTLQIDHPAATLQQPATLIIQRTAPWYFFGRGHTEQQHLVLHETSAKSRVTGLSISQIQAAQHGPDPVQGQLTFPTLPTEISPNKTAEAVPTLHGATPRGTSTGSLTVTATQLGAPLSVSFEIRNRRDAKAIFLIAIAGALLGFLLRVVLKALMQLYQARLTAEELLAEIHRELERTPDSTFNLTVGPLRQPLEDRLSSLRATDITSLVTSTNTALQTALTELNTRRVNTQQTIDIFRALLHRSWRLPEAGTAALSQAQQSLPQAVALVAGNDPTAAEARLEEIKSELGKQLSEAALSWLTGVDPLLNYLADEPQQPPLPDDYANSVRAAAKIAKTQIAAIPTDANTSSESLLTGVHNAYVASRLLIIPRLLPLATTVTSILNTAKAPNHAVLSKLATAADDTDSAQAGYERGEVAGSDLAASIKLFLGALTDAIRRQISKDRPAPINDALAAGKYALAATLTAAELENGTLGGDTLLREEAATPEASRAVYNQNAIFAAVSELTSSAVPTTTVLQIVRRGLAIPTLPNARTVLTLAGAYLLQTVIVLIVTALIIYGLYNSKFEGTTSDILTVFFAAFAADLTAEGVAQAAKTFQPSKGPTGQ